MHLQFKALPFSLSTTPRVFTKLLVNPVTYLRQQGLHLHPYLDDLLIRAPSYRQAIQDTQTIMACLQDHGFLISRRARSVQNRLDHLGMTLDTRCMKLYLIPARIRNTRELASIFLRRQVAGLMTLTQLLGLLVANMEALQRRRLHARDL